MSNSNDYSVQPHDDGWEVKRDGASRASSVHDIKADAVDAGRDLAQKSGGELRIKGQDGQIQNSNSYGNDPCPPRDTKH